MVFRGAAVPAGAAAVVVAVVAALAAGVRGLVGALLGAALAVAFFGAGLLVAQVTRARSPATVMGAAMLTYTAKIALLAVFLVSFRGGDAFHTDWFAVSLLVCAIAWLVAHARVVGRLRVPLDVPVASPRRPDP